MFTKIRKNATKQIDELLAQARKIECQVRYSDYYTDGFHSADVYATEAELREWMEDNYADLVLRLYKDQDGNNCELVITKNSWSKETFTISFKPNTDVIKTEFIEEAPVKPRVTLEVVQKYLKAGFTAPLNHGGKKHEKTEAMPEKQIKKIRVLWSESRHFKDDTNLTMDEYNGLEWLVLVDERAEGNMGYCKTKLELTLGTGEVVTFRHDICIKEKDLQTQWSAWVDYCLKEDAA